jgi:ribose/xylose/arabinose/galactoside ABC-type transport system permease subunit
MRSDLILLLFAVAAILIAGAAMHGGRGKRWPGSEN